MLATLNPVFSIYLGEEYGHQNEHPTIEECFAKLASMSPKSRAEKLRDQAAALLKQADELESVTL